MVRPDSVVIENGPNQVAEDSPSEREKDGVSYRVTWTVLLINFGFRIEQYEDEIVKTPRETVSLSFG